ncbi:MAG: helix-turn-helix domain-containing protein [Treponema sp.]|jgi:SOS-response transcriptional repressor LexA/DNA-binding XRE family transcriptional regulator|nr:helix-turn-helix domain-containing protein [Treponema sp.]
MLNVGPDLKIIRKKMGKSQREIAAEFGLPQTTWASYEVGKASPPMKILFKLAEMGYPIKGLTTGVLQDLEDEGKISKAEFQRRLEIARAFPPEMPAEDFARAVDAVDKNPKQDGINPLKLYLSSDLPEGSFVVPLLDQRLSAGPGAALPEKDEAKALIPVPGYLRQYGENIAALTVDGDSMEPTLHRGDMVVCDSCGWSGEGIYAVRMGESGFVKRLTKAPGKVVIISDNSKYPPREEPEGSEDFQVIGRVHCAITKVE